MKIRFKKGRKFDGDRLFSIETNGEEIFTHARLMILINALAKNEYQIYKKGEWDKRGMDEFERRNNKKNRADKLGRHLLCIQHHKEYEQALNLLLKTTAKNFAHSYLKKEDDTKAITKP